MKEIAEHRQAVAAARRIVVKVGSRVLVQRSGRPDSSRMRALVKDLARAHRDGRDIVLVSSGAIGAGMEALRLKTRPTNLPDLQMAAAVGQMRLMAKYEKLFAAEKCRVGQVLLTHADLKDRRRHLNARHTVLNLLRHDIVPIVNENDVVAVDEIKFGDNDFLSALVTHLIQADLLILLTVTDGLREPTASGRSRRVSFLSRISPTVRQWASGSDSPLSVGGMSSKVQAAEDVLKTGGMAVIANGRKTGVVSRILAGEDFGTLLADPDRDEAHGWSGRKRWIAFFHRASGTLAIDDGARKAVGQQGKSLLPIGITGVSGRFQTGDVVNIVSGKGELIARGLAEYSSEEVAKIKGRRTSEIAGILGAKDYDEVVHRDNMVLLGGETRIET